MNLAKILWIAGSILMNVTIAIYIWLSSNAPVDDVQRFQYVNENWLIYSAHWKAELVFMTFITIGAFYFTLRIKRIGWSIVTIGQLILITMYPMMLGGYRNTSYEIFTAVNQIAMNIFIFGNIIFLIGLALVYRNAYEISKWLRILAASFASVACLVFFVSFIGFVDWRQAIIIVGPLVSLIYFINAYYGYKIEVK